MPSHSSIAASVRRDKEEHPWRYCADTRCLFRTSEKWCPKHGTTSRRRESLLDPEDES